MKGPEYLPRPDDISLLRRKNPPQTDPLPEFEIGVLQAEGTHRHCCSPIYALIDRAGWPSTRHHPASRRAAGSDTARFLCTALDSSLPVTAEVLRTESGG